MNQIEDRFSEKLWRIYNRPDPPKPWIDDGNLPWNDPAFSKRMLREHLDQSHGAASRRDPERALQINWFREKLNLKAGDHLLDVTCGPGLYAVDYARMGCKVTGIDFGPASIAYARTRAEEYGVADRIHFHLQDVRAFLYSPLSYDAATFIYGQLGVFRREEAAVLLHQIASALKPGARLVVELLNDERVDKKDSTWWFTDDTGLWGDRPFLHLGQRNWLEEEQIVVEQFTTINLETAETSEVNLCDQIYRVPEMVEMMKTAGFNTVDVYPAWENVPLYDKDEWVVYIAAK